MQILLCILIEYQNLRTSREAALLILISQESLRVQANASERCHEVETSHPTVHCYDSPYIAVTLTSSLYLIAGKSMLSRESECTEDLAPLGSSAPATYRHLPDPRLASISNVDALAAVVGSMETGDSSHLHLHGSR